MKNSVEPIPPQFALDDEDIYAAMKEIPGYLDITASDFKELYALSYRHALNRIIHSVRVAEVMTRDVVSVERTTPLHEVAERMATAGVSGLLVLGAAGRPVGIISERDFLKHLGAAKAAFTGVIAACLRGKGCAAVNISNGVAQDIMTSPLIASRPDATLGEAATMMTSHRVNRLPVLDDQGALLGILTRTDMVRAHIVE